MRLPLMVSLAMCISATTSLATAQEADDLRSIFEKEREAYDPVTRSIGSFDVSPSISVTGTSTSNVYASDNNEESDFITVIKPSVALKSNWYQHGLQVKAGGNIGRYADFTDESYADYNTSVSGQLDVTTNDQLYGSLSLNQMHESRGTPEDVGGTEQTAYRQYGATAGYKRTGGLVTLDINTKAEKTDFDSTDTVFGEVLNSERDYWTYTTGMTVSYAFKPNYYAYIGGSYNTVRYDINPSLVRDSNGYAINVGTGFKVTGTLKGKLYSGYIAQDYDDQSLSDISNIDFGGELIWNFSPISSLLAQVDRTVEETTLNNTSGYVSTASNISLEHELRYNVLVGAGLGVTYNDYEANAIQAREDTLYKANAKATYLLTKRGLSVSGGYYYINRESNIFNQDYDDNKFLVSVSASM